MSKRTLVMTNPLGIVSSSSAPRRRLHGFSGDAVQSRGRFARYRGTISRGFTRRAGFYGRYNMGSDSAGELKFFDTTVNDTLIATGGTVSDSLNLVVQGVTEVQRIGRKFTIRSLEWKGTLGLAEKDAVATPQASDVVRMIVYQDKQANGATATAAQLLDTQTPLGFYNLENKGRFKILYDKNFTMNATNLASDGAGLVSSSSTNKYFTWRKKLNIPVEMGGVTGAITEVRSNNIGLMVTSLFNQTQLTSKFRIRFSDG